mgnify:CR=1 FL=1
MEPRRCATHGLMASEDGRCVICRRGETPDENRTSSDLPVVILVAVVGVAAVGVLGYGLTMRIRGLVQAEPPPVAVVPPKPEPQPAAVPTAPGTLRTDADRKDFPSFLEDSSKPVADQVGPPSDELLEKEKRKIPITMYARDNCRLCDNARIWLKQSGYRLKELDIQRSPTDRVLLESINPSGSVPTFDVDGKVLVGYDRQVIDDVLSEMAEKRLKPKP